MKTKTQIRRNQVSISPVLVEDLFHQIPGCEHQPPAYAAAMAALVHEDLQTIATAYRHSCTTRTGREMAKLFMQNMIQGDE